MPFLVKKTELFSRQLDDNEVQRRGDIITFISDIEGVGYTFAAFKGELKVQADPDGSTLGPKLLNTARRADPGGILYKAKFGSEFRIWFSYNKDSDCLLVLFIARHNKDRSSALWPK